MRRNLAYLLSVAACGALVASCGGGNNDPIGSPTPTPSETPSPTPTPTPTTSNLDFGQDFEKTTTNANIIYAYFTPQSGGTEVFNDASRLNGTAAVQYSVDGDTVFAFPGLSQNVTFPNGTQTGKTTTSVTYEQGDDTLTLSIPNGDVLRATLQRSQDYTQDSIAGTLRSQRVAIFFNPVTTTTAIGSTLSYSGQPQVAGGVLGETPSGAISSPAITLSVATDGTVTGTIRIYRMTGGTQQLVAELPISEQVDASGQFVEEVDDTARGLTGRIVGALAGANREELVVLFSVSDIDDDDTITERYVGTLIAAR
ncbi:hypothetical protein [Aurantiacibacter spongiae]|uniref:Uncharacterized protein n=1 Tax=Aurantiacibacter spongiae TaxID=2488860 RepID=A0A3N5CZT1_9SPHN|nr:hypothetical protein [Aurantiacibacter spongiae]RPF72239.1 hypothetical protein EG799_11845 [Aurantiacibacter spongiae]